jgi:hypothetical protein
MKITNFAKNRCNFKGGCGKMAEVYKNTFCKNNII